MGSDQSWVASLMLVSHDVSTWIWPILYQTIIVTPENGTKLMDLVERQEPSFFRFVQHLVCFEIPGPPQAASVVKFVACFAHVPLLTVTRAAFTSFIDVTPESRPRAPDLICVDNIPLSKFAMWSPGSLQHLQRLGLFAFFLNGENWSQVAFAAPRLHTIHVELASRYGRAPDVIRYHEAEWHSMLCDIPGLRRLTLRFGARDTDEWSEGVVAMREFVAVDDTRVYVDQNHIRSSTTPADIDRLFRLDFDPWTRGEQLHSPEAQHYYTRTEDERRTA